MDLRGVRFVAVSKLKPQLLSVISKVADAGEEYIVTKNGKPAAIIMNYDDWESYIETLEILSDKKAMKQIRKSEEYFKKGGKGYTVEEVFGPK